MGVTPSNTTAQLSPPADSLEERLRTVEMNIMVSKTLSLVCTAVAVGAVISLMICMQSS